MKQKCLVKHFREKIEVILAVDKTIRNQKNLCSKLNIKDYELSRLKSEAICSRNDSVLVPIDLLNKLIALASPLGVDLLADEFNGPLSVRMFMRRGV